MAASVAACVVRVPARRATRRAYGGLSSSLSACLSPFFSTRRNSASLAESVAMPEFRRVPFVREELSEVLREVPDVKYYFVGGGADDASPSSNPFRDTPMRDPVIDESSFAPYQAPSGELQFSVLENGLRIASLDRGGLVTSLGLFVDAGSRDEDASNFGVSQMLQTMAFHSTAHLSFLRTVKTIEVLGASAGCVAGREHTVYSAECLRRHVPLLVPMLTGNVLFPRFLPWEIKQNSEKLLQSRMRVERAPDQAVSELLHQTAWHNNSLGLKGYATEKSLQFFHADTMRSFMLRHFSPANSVFVGVDVDHEELCKWVRRAFTDYAAIPNSSKSRVSPPVYTGGDVRVEAVSPHAHIAIAFEAPGGWNGKDLVALSVLQTLLGGGGAFSTGGPGKGMYTRLYLDVLNRHEWVESAVAFNTQYSDAGLFGLYILAAPEKAASAVEVLAEQFSKMKNASEEELVRAKNALKASIHMNLECRGIVLEDVGRQLLMSRRVVSPSQFCAAVDAVTAADIRRASEELFLSAPTVVAFGDISAVPHHREICAALRSAGVGGGSVLSGKPRSR